MYFDQNLLRIIFGIQKDDEENFTKALELYENTITKISEDVFNIYMKNTNIRKPAIKGLMNLVNYKDKKDSLTDDEEINIYLDALAAASSTPEFIQLMNEAVTAFHKELITGRMETMTEDQKNEFREYLDKLKDTVIENTSVVKKIVKDMERNNN